MKPRIAAAFTLLLAASAALAARPRAFVHQSEADFTTGKFDNVIVDSYGQLKLGRALTAVALPKPSEHIAGFAAAADGAVIAATSEGIVYRITGSKAEAIYTAPKSVVLATCVALAPNGDVLLGVTGEEGANILRIDAKAAKPVGKVIASPKGADTIWSIRTGPGGTIYAATGGEKGALHKLAADNKAEQLFETESRNITALAFDKAGHALVGTDAGLVIRLDKDSKKPFVLHDAGKVDVNAIVTDDAGNIYVATALADSLGGMGTGHDFDGMGDKSKPSDAEPDEAPTPDENTTAPASQPKKSKPGAAIMIPAGIHADTIKNMPADLKDMLGKLDLVTSKKPTKVSGPTTKRNNKSPIKKPTNKPRRPMPNLPSHDAEEPASAVYRIATDGNVTTLVDEADTNYALVLQGGELLIGTGSEGKLYAYNLAEESLALIARLNEETITALLPTKDGVYLGTANSGQVFTLGAAAAKSGTFTSSVLDATNTATFGALRVTAETPAGAAIKTEIRTGNTRDVETHGKLWSDWTDLSTIKNAPTARFIQYRLTLTGDGTAASPTVSGVRLAYATQNQAPRIKNLAVETEHDETAESAANGSSLAHSEHLEEPTRNVTITWDATDPNGDDLTYRVLYRTVGAKSADAWTTLARDLKETTFDWQTKTVPDGKYQVKVIASDAADNTPDTAKSSARETAAITIDHTAPAVGDLAVTVDGNRVTLAGDAKDALSNIVDVRLQVDNQGDWQPAAASDKMFDSPNEAFTATTRALAPGNHRITVRVTDAAGNSSYKAVTVTVK